MSLDGDIRDSFAKYSQKAVKIAETEFAKWEQLQLKDIFDKVIKSFYKSYSPEGVYSYTRTYGLYDLFAPNGGNENGAILDFPNDYSNLYDSAKMHPGRDGYDGLFHLVFEEGYHGGAKSISPEKAVEWYPHPSPGTPFWRTDGFRRSSHKWHPYAMWGDPAQKAKTPPKEDLEKRMNKYFPKMEEYYNRLIDKHIDEGFDNYIDSDIMPKIDAYLGF